MDREMEGKHIQDTNIATNTQCYSTNEGVLQDGAESLQPAVHGADISPEAPAKAEEQEFEYVTGIKLALILVSVTVVCFLMMLDMSIVTTVGGSAHRLSRSYEVNTPEGNSENHKPVPLPRRRWMVRKCVFVDKVATLPLSSSSRVLIPYLAPHSSR